jgi:hypothetical protein
LIPAQISSTYDVLADEIASIDNQRLVAFEGAEDRLRQLTVGIRERCGWYTPPWDSDEREAFIIPNPVADDRRSDRLDTSFDDCDPVWQTLHLGDSSDSDEVDGPASSAVPRPKGPRPQPSDTAENPPRD